MINFIVVTLKETEVENSLVIQFLGLAFSLPGFNPWLGKPKIPQAMWYDQKKERKTTKTLKTGKINLYRIIYLN